MTRDLQPLLVIAMSLTITAVFSDEDILYDSIVTSNTQMYLMTCLLLYGSKEQIASLYNSRKKQRNLIWIYFET